MFNSLKVTILIFLLLGSFIFSTSLFGQSKFKNDTAFINKATIQLNDYLVRNIEDSAHLLANTIHKLSTEINYSYGIANANYNLALIFINQSRFNNALEHLLQSIEHYKLIKNTEGIIKCEIQIGLIYYILKNYGKALENFKHTLQYSEEISRNAMLYYLSGLCLTELGNFGEAEKYLKKAHDFYVEKKIPKRATECEVALADLYTLKQNFNKAIKYYNNALTKFIQNEENPGISICYLGIGKIHFLKQEFDSALYFTKNAYTLSDSFNFFSVKEKAAHQLSKIYTKLGDFKHSLHFLQEYYATRDSVMSSDNLTAVTSIESELKFIKQQSQLEILQKQRQVDKILIFSVIGGIALLLILSFSIFKMYRTERKAKDLIHIEKERSEKLLLNILPKETADELKLNGKALARKFEKATVLFADIKGFTIIAEHVSPEKIVGMIDQYFCAFDEICEKYEIEKIKTIGDAYLCAGGLPNPEKGKPDRVVQAACEMQIAIKKINESKTDSEPKFDIRIGIHTGPVVAGVVGNKKFAYDIWGDTVNTAARMEQSSEPGKINVSGTTYELVKDKFKFEYRGKISAKNKGEIDMYFVVL